VLAHSVLLAPKTCCALRVESHATPAQLRLLGLGAFLTRQSRSRFDVLGGTHRGEGAVCRLVASFGISTSEEAREWVSRALDRAETSPHPAWDLGRAVSWAGHMYVAFFLDEGAAWAMVLRAASLVSDRFSSWESFGEDYLHGRQAFMGRRGKGKDDEEAVLAWLLRAKSSPWATGTWETPWEGTPPRGHVPEVLHVGGTRKDTFRTIAEAVARAKPGDVVAISPGTYQESLRPMVDVSFVVSAAESGKSRRKTKATTSGDVEIVAHDHALFVDGVSVSARGIRWVGEGGQSAVGVQNGGVLRLSECQIESASHGVSVLGPDTLARLEGVVVSRSMGIAVTVSDRAALQASNVRIENARIGVSVEKKSTAKLSGVRVKRALEVGLRVNGKSSAEVFDSLFARARSSGVQVSDRGSLALSSSGIEGCGTGLLVQRAKATLREVRIASVRGNGLELQKGSVVVAEGLVVEKARGSSVFVAAEAELLVTRATLELSGADGVTCAGLLHAEDVTVRGAVRAGFWLDGPSLAMVRRSATEGGRLGARIGQGARVSIESTTFATPGLGVATEGGSVALESVWISSATAQSVQVDGGTLVAGYLTVEGSSEHSLFVANGHATVVSSRLESAGEVHVNGPKAQATLRRTTVSTPGDVGCALHDGKLELAFCRVEAKGSNAIEGLGGDLTIVSCSVEGTACGLVLGGDARARVEGGELRATDDVALEVRGRAHATLEGVVLATPIGSASRRARTATLELGKSKRARARPKHAPFVPDLDGEGPLPFELGIHLGPSYSLFTGDIESVVFPHAEAFSEHGVPLDGRRLAAWVSALLVPPLAVTFDAESGLFSLESDDRDVLMAAAKSVREALLDGARVRALLDVVRSRGGP
jgi:hypothetical protein